MSADEKVQLFDPLLQPLIGLAGGSHLYKFIKLRIICGIVILQKLSDQIPTDRGLLDGTCYVEVTEDGSYLDVNNQLVTYEYHAEEPIRTPEEALKLIQDGCFGNGWRYDAHLFGEFSVQSCTLSYALDTKGFYQPVYYFEVTSPDWYSTATILIPAIA